MIKELQYKGYATEPSDYECPDGQLATSLNLINEDNQLKPVFQPAEIAQLPEGFNVKFIHLTTTQKNYIITSDNKIYYLTQSQISQQEITPTLIRDFLTDGIIKITPVGNTLAILADSGLHYILFNSQLQYTYLGQKPPLLNIAFSLHSTLSCYPKDKKIGDATVHQKAAYLNHFIDSTDVIAPFISDDDPIQWVSPKDVAGDGFTAWDYSLEGNEPAQQYVNTWSNFALGNIQRLVREQATDKGLFVYPFFVRWAYELHDGSLIMHSDPVLLIPNSKYPFFALDGHRGLGLLDVGNDNRRFTFWGRAYAFISTLKAKIINSDAIQILDQLNSQWNDIIKGIAIYVSPPIYTYKQDGKVYGWTNMDQQGAWDEFFTEAHMYNGIVEKTKQWKIEEVFPVWNEESAPEGDTDFTHRYFDQYDAQHTMPSFIFTMPEKNKGEIADDIENVTFHKVKDYDFDDSELILMTVQEQTVEIDEGVLNSLVTRQIKNDDYHSHDIIKPKDAYNYNGRLNIAGITRSLHKPLAPDSAWPYRDDNNTQWQITVQLKTPGQTHVVSSLTAYNGTDFPRFIFYPDRRAEKVWLKKTYNGTAKTYTLTLKEHPMLEGAFWCAPLDAVITAQETTDPIPQDADGDVQEHNKIYTSEVNNPFYFPVLGINTVGTGTILGISAAAKAMSQGQFGQFPLYAFTTEGVWALEVSSTGSYSARQPITRDVCINPDSITQLDSAVLFATDRGIMLISGSQTQCITDGIFSEAPFNVLDLPGIDQLHAKLGHPADACLPVKPFLGFLADCQMVYDYVHQRIFVYNPTMENGSPKYTYAYVFSLKSKMWGMVFTNLASTINAYPEALAMTHAGKLVSFSETDEQVCKGLYITRPLKLEAADVHKTISALIQRGHFQRGDVGTVLYGSRDLYSWHLIWSSKDHYLRGFRGTPYKYFRIAGLAALTDGKSIFGASVNFEPRHTNQLR